MGDTTVKHVARPPTPNDASDHDWVSLGYVTRPHGLKGGLHVKLHHGSSETLRAGVDVRIGTHAHTVLAFEGDRLQLKGVSDRNAADALRAHELFARRVDFAAQAGDVFLVDVVGADVFDPAGALLGRADRFEHNGAQPLLIVARVGGGEASVPFVAPLVVEASSTRVVLDLPAGLLTLEQDTKAHRAAPDDGHDDDDAVDES